MFMNQSEIEHAASRPHSCPNVRKGLKLLLALMEAVNAQSDGWAYWKAPSKSAEKLEELLQTAGKMDGNIRRPLTHGTQGPISAAALKKAIAPIRAMVTRQKKLQAERGNKFEFDVDAVLQPLTIDALANMVQPVKVIVEIVVDTQRIANRFGIDTADKAVQHWIENETSWPEFVQNISVKDKFIPVRQKKLFS